MALELVLRENLSTPTVAATLVLNGQADITLPEVATLIYFWKWADEPDMEYQYLCEGLAGQPASTPFDPKGRAMLISQVGRTDTGQLNAVGPKDGEVYYFNPTASRPSTYTVQTLFTHSADAATSGTSDQSLYSDSLAADTLGVDDTIIWALYAGEIANPANEKFLRLKFGSNTLVNEEITGESGDWQISATIIRKSSSVIRYSLQLDIGSVHDTVQGEVTGLDLHANAYTLDLRAQTTDAAGDVTAKQAHAIKIPPVS